MNIAGLEIWMDLTEPAAASPRFWQTRPTIGEEGSLGDAHRSELRFTAPVRVASRGTQVAWGRVGQWGTRASLMNHKQWAFGSRAGGPDEEGVRGYVSGAAWDAGRSCVTPGVWSEGHAGEPASARGARASLLVYKKWAFPVSSSGPKTEAGRTRQACWDT